MVDFKTRIFTESDNDITIEIVVIRMDYSTDHTKDIDDIFYATKESQGYVSSL